MEKRVEDFINRIPMILVVEKLPRKIIKRDISLSIFKQMVL